MTDRQMEARAHLPSQFDERLSISPLPAFPRKSLRQISRARGKIENRVRIPTGDNLRCAFAPDKIASAAQQVIRQIVAWRNPPKHFADRVRIPPRGIFFKRSQSRVFAQEFLLRKWWWRRRMSLEIDKKLPAMTEVRRAQPAKSGKRAGRGASAADSWKDQHADDGPANC